MSGFDFMIFQVVLGQARDPSVLPLSGNDLTGIIAIAGAIGGPMLIGLVAILASAAKQIARAYFDSGLKHKMLSLGYSAADIERVLQASTPTDGKCASRAVVSPTPSPDVILAQPIK